jgi:hypothetical protein
MALGKDIFLNTFFAECQVRWHSAKNFQTKLKTFAECRVSGHSTKNFHKKRKMKTLCQVAARLALGKAVVAGSSAVMAPFLCRVLSERSAKPLPTNGTRQRWMIFS